MNIRKIFGYGTRNFMRTLTVMFALAALSLTGCGDVGVEITTGTTNNPNTTNPNTTPVDTGITYTAVQTGGTEATADSTGIVFTFKESIDSIGLTAADIAVTGVAEKGGSDLTGSGTTWTLPITVNSAGNASVKITKAGIEAATKSVVVYKVGEYNPKILSSISASFDDDNYTVYTTMQLNHLKNGLTVTATYTDTSTAPVAAADYTLNGNISTPGKKTITVSYTLGTVTRTTTFSVDVELPPPYGISLAPITFSPVTYGYSAQTPQEVVISNIGTEDTGELTIAIDDDSNAFTLSENTHASIDSGEEGSFTVTPNTSLNAGVYTATITVSNSENEISQSIIISFTVNPVYPTLDNFTITGIGTFEWDGEAKTVTVTENDSNWGSITVLYNGMAGSSTFPRSPGSYTVTFSVAASMDGNYAGGTLSAGTLTIGPPTLTSASQVSTYLQEADGGSSAGDPVDLIITFDLGDMTQNGSDWQTLLNAIGSANKYVNLDLSACTMTGTEFNTTSYNSGKSYVVSLKLPNVAESISAGTNPFSDFYNITSVTADPSNNNFETVSGILYNKAKTQFVFVPKTISGAITIPAGITSIGTMFRQNSNITSVTFEAGSQLTAIDEYAFYDCTSLTSVTFETGSQLTAIDEYAFYDCTSLTNVTFGTNSQLTTIGYGAFYYCTSLISINIPASVTSIGAFAFCGEYDKTIALTSVTFAADSQLQTIGNNAFRYCTSLTSITLPNNLTSIGNSAFANCTSLSSINIPNSVTSIGVGTFSSCYNLSSVTMGIGVTSIGQSAFNICYNLSSVTFAGTIAEANFNTDAFPGDLRTKFYADNPANGTPGTYTTTNPGSSPVWTKE